jgi:ribonuclease HI
MATGSSADKSQMASASRRKRVEIWTDGAASRKEPGSGGHAAILLFPDRDQVIRGGALKTTHQRMELLAAVTALESLEECHDVALFTDSAYLCDCFTLGWWHQWLWNGWRNSKGKAVANQDLWIRLLIQNCLHHIDWQRVPGHSEDYPMNQLCDTIAVSEKHRYLLQAAPTEDQQAA